MRYLTWGFVAIAALTVVGLMAGCGGGDAQSAPAAPKTDAKPAPQSDVTPIVSEKDAPAPDAVPTDNPVTQIEPPEAPEAPLPEVVAKVGDSQIAGKDLQRRLDLNTQMMAARGMPVKLDDQQKREMLEDMVRERVMEQMAAKAGFTATEEEARAKIAEGKKGISEEEFQQYLTQNKMQEADLVELLKSGIVQEKYVNDMTKNISVTDEEVAAEYETLKAGGRLNRDQKTADFSHILIKVEGADEAKWNEAKTRIDAAKARIAAGEDFAAVAKEVSEDPGSAKRGGEYRETAAGTMVKEVEEKLFTMPLNEVSEPFRTEFGWHIMKVTAVHEPGTASLEDVKPLIQERLKAKKSREVLDKTIEDGVKNVSIEILYPEGSSKSLTPKPAPVPIPAPAPAPEAPAPAPAPESAPAAPAAS